MGQRSATSEELTDLHPSTKTKNQMKGGLFLNVVVREGTTVLQLLSSKNQTLLVRRNTFLVLNLCLDIIDSITRLDLESDGLAGN